MSDSHDRDREPDRDAGTSAHLTRRERHRVETRAEILETARAILIHQGVEDLTLREVARWTGFNPASLYRYFASKQELLLAVAQESLDLLADHLEKVPKDRPADERLMELGITYLEFSRDHPEEMPLVFATLPEIDPDNQLSVLPTRLWSIIHDILEDGVRTGVFKASDEDDLAAMFHGAWGFVHGLAEIARIDRVHARVFGLHQRALMQVFINGLKTDWYEHDHAEDAREAAS